METKLSIIKQALIKLRKLINKAENWYSSSDKMLTTGKECEEANECIKIFIKLLLIRNIE